MTSALRKGSENPLEGNERLLLLRDTILRDTILHVCTGVFCPYSVLRFPNFP